MKYIDEFRQPELVKKIVERIHQRSTRPARFMEFCGGHTVSIFKYGIRQLLPDTIEMLSGPGCPVCVTSNSDLDKAIALAHLPDVIITSFGDMIRVPGSYSSLQVAKAEGCDVRVVYSVLDAVTIAKQNPAKSVIFVGIGFETTSPTIAAAVLQAEQEGTDNFYILSLGKYTPPIIKSILELGEVRLDGIVCPGHVSAITGSEPYRSLAESQNIACVVSGFEPLDILLCIAMLVEQVETGNYKVEIAYKRGVKPEGNVHAVKIMNTVFEPAEADWRGIGIVPSSGLALRGRYSRFDALKQFTVDPGPVREHKGCICGSILRGINTPYDCKLFRSTCTPEHPVGPCMVSSEGSCSTYYLYGDIDG
ncbi:MAG: hydrogenase formation protein HypD [Dehalococcoidales bacterium]|nr:hydrogenase formation protein HypD [Dehalococcoidales bacterium]